MANQYFLADGAHGGQTLEVTNGTGSSGTKSLFELNSILGNVGGTYPGTAIPHLFQGPAFAYGSNYFFVTENKNGLAAFSTDGNSVYALDPALTDAVTSYNVQGSVNGIRDAQSYLAADGTPEVAFGANVASSTDSENFQLALSNGTGAGTRVATALVKGDPAEPVYDIQQSGSSLYFSFFNKTGSFAKYATDGTNLTLIDPVPGTNSAPAGPVLPVPFTNAAGQPALAYFGGKINDSLAPVLALNFTTGTGGAGTKQFIVSDTGDPNATFPIQYELVASGSNVFGTAQYFTGPSSSGLVKVFAGDGNTAGVVQADSSSGDYDTAVGLTPFTNAAGQAEVAFVANDESVQSNPANLGRHNQIYVTTGSNGRTVTEVTRDLAIDVTFPSQGSNFITIPPVVSGNTFYFVGQPRGGTNQVYATNGGQAVRLDPNAGSSVPTIVDAGGVIAYTNAAGLAGIAFFGNTSTTGGTAYQVLTSNGLAGGTVAASGFSFLKPPSGTLISNNRIFFIGQDSGSSIQAFSSDGQTVTRLDLNPAGSPPSLLNAGNLTAFTTSAGANGVAFTANAGTLAAPNYQVFVSDGTSTVNVTKGLFNFTAAPTSLVANGGNIYWNGTDASGLQDIYSSDGRTAVRDDPNAAGGSFQGVQPIAVTTAGVTPRAAVQPDATSGTTTYAFNVERGGDLTQSVSFSYNINSSSPAAAGLFNTPLNGTVTFARGQSLSILSVGVKGQTLSTDVGFTVTLRGVAGTVAPDSSTQPKIPINVLSFANGIIQQNVTPQPTPTPTPGSTPTPTPAPTPTPTPTPTPSGNPSVAAFVSANLPAGAYTSTGIALASAGLGALAGASGTVVGASSATGSFAAPTAGAVNVAIATNPASGSTVALPFGYGAVVAMGANAVTLSDAGAAGAVLVGDAGPTTFNSTGQGVSLVGGAGANRFNVSGSATIATGSGSSTVSLSGQAAANVFTGTGGSTVVLAGGASTVQANGQDTVFGGAGAATVTAAKGAVAIGGAGLLTYTGGSATSVVFGGKGGLTFIGGSAFEIAVGTTGPLNARAGSGGGEFFGNAGGDFMQSGSGQTIMVLSAGGKAVSTGSAGNYLVAGAGTATLDGSAATGNDVFFGGTGQDAILCGSGSDLIGTGTGTSTVQLGSGTTTVFAFGTSTVTSGSGSASVVMGGAVRLNVAAGAARSFALFNFVPGTDKIGLSGYDGSTIGAALANQVNGAGQTVLTLSDNTQIQLIGVARADAGFFA